MTIKKYIPFVAALGAFLFGYFASNCGVDRDCSLFSFFREFEDSILDPLWVYSLYVLFPALIAIFLPQKIFKNWLYVSLGFIVFSVVVISMFPTSSGLFTFYERHMIVPILGQAFFTISIITILVQSFLVWNRSKRTNSIGK